MASSIITLKLESELFCHEFRRLQLLRSFAFLQMVNIGFYQRLTATAMKSELSCFQEKKNNVSLLLEFKRINVCADADLGSVFGLHTES